MSIGFKATKAWFEPGAAPLRLKLLLHKRKSTAFISEAVLRLVLHTNRCP